MTSFKGVFFRFFGVYSVLSDSIKKISTVFCYGLLVFVTSVSGLAVFYRYVLNDPIQWTEEIARYTLIWMSLVGASIAIKERKHINLTSIVRHIPKPFSIYLEIMLFLVIIVIASVIAKYSWLMVVTRSVRKFSPSMAVSMLWPHSALPVGFGLIVLQSIYVLFEDIKELISAEPDEQNKKSK